MDEGRDHRPHVGVGVEVSGRFTASGDEAEPELVAETVPGSILELDTSCARGDGSDASSPTGGDRRLNVEVVLLDGIGDGRRAPLFDGCCKESD